MKSARKPQLVQNVVAQPWTSAKYKDRTLPVLKDMQCLPIAYWAHLKMLVFIFKAFNGLGPDCLQSGLLQTCWAI